MARLNSEETLWTVLPIIIVVVLLVAGIIFLPQTGTDVRSRASEPLKIVTPEPIPTKTVPPEVVCSDLYDPVCGSNKITYPNECEAKLAGVSVFVSGACTTQTQKKSVATPIPRVTTTLDTQMQYTLPLSN